MDTAADVLVVDDDVSIVEFICDALLEEGYTIRTAYNGAVALREIQARPPALVLLDHTMPGMTGGEVLLRVRAGGFSSLPVIMMSAGIRAEALLGLGTTDFIAKPFILDELLDCITRHIQLQVRAF
jgi:DNA-binding response OmpR family regulator